MALLGILSLEGRAFIFGVGRNYFFPKGDLILNCLGKQIFPVKFFLHLTRASFSFGHFRRALKGLPFFGEPGLGQV